MAVDAEPLGHIINELALVQISAGMVELAPAIVKIVFPKAFIDCAVGPAHDTIAVLDVLRALEHLPRVDGALLAVLVDAQAMDVGKVSGLVLVELLFDYFVALVEALASRMSSEVGLSLDNLLLFLKQQSILNTRQERKVRTDIMATRMDDNNSHAS